jgi:Predicted outer membrane protein
MSVSRKTCGAVILCLLLFVSTAHAQNENGSIRGRVTDTTGAVLQGATVRLAPKGGTGVTDNQGEYLIAGLATGEYTVSVSYVGFKVFTKR